MRIQKKESVTKKFTEEAQLTILGEVKEKGLKVTLKKYDLLQATYYYCKIDHPEFKWQN